MHRQKRTTRNAARTGTIRAGLAVALASALSLGSTLAPTLAHAQGSRDTDPKAAPSPWAYCERAAIAIEATQKMPRALLVSVSMAETGRRDPETRKTRPWPWTINAEGQSFYFDTKREAVAATKRLLNAGIRSIDVGCMQVNLRYHPDAFDDLYDAFEPLTNVTYAAKFLKRLHTQTDSWPKAVANYHSELASRNKPYFAKVIRIWANERDRVAALTEALKAEAAAEIASAQRPQASTPSVAQVAIVEPQQRPAPMVLDAEPQHDLREGASATVGLRLSVADNDFATGADSKGNRPAPRVIDPAPNTVVADASTDLRLP
ncbi:transglycosylase SLT domain-containing protein [Parvibaculum sedimenti]|uniref:Transglycosylase SLT domain-containing protein n=1 Tax=Parvibaculum sedimenti TaxID=2608632 RepID=A0A6N6VI24_9HYPH|nr:transglycosylase SLT domain-containing protein [Parvibaculum sedimenti]KAB7740716.1 transglycosylase SLT domain-containing protein [Parvibaculum sedimenti]